MSFFRVTRSGAATFCKFPVAASVAGAGGWQLWTMHCYFEPFGPENDPLFQSKYFKQHNPRNHPSLNDSCVRKVPLSQIPPELVNDALNGGSNLLERFCAGVWGGYGECSRAYAGKPTVNLTSVLLTDCFLFLYVQDTPSSATYWRNWDGMTLTRTRSCGIESSY